MTTESITQDRSEKVLLLLLIGVSVFMIIRAQRWEFQTSIFPQFTAIVTLLGSVLLLVRRYLPKPLQTFVAESVDSFQQSEDMAEEEISSDSKKKRTTTARPLSPTQFTAALIAGYVALGTLFGVWWVTPLFIIVYSLWFRVPFSIAGALIVTSIILIYVFRFVFIVPIDEGIIFDTLLRGLI